MNTVEFWETEVATMPPRSRLYQLSPLGVGTSEVECITSYIVRLAHAHLLTPSVVVLKEIAPAFQDRTMRLSDGHSDLLGSLSACLNGQGETGEELVSILTNLTGARDLGHMTLKKFRGVVAIHDLLRRYQAWCPVCLEERENKPYYRLIWCLQDCEVCPKHEVRLQERCPKCGKTQKPLARKSVIGQCARCETSLTNGTFERVSSKSKESRRACQIAKILEWFQAVKPERFVSLFSENAKRLLRIGCQNNKANFARLVANHPDSVTQWVEGKQVPKLRSILGVAEAFSVCPLALLSTRFDEHTTFSVKSSRMRRRRLRSHDYREIQKKIEAILAANEFPPRSLARISADLGCDQTSVLRSCPEVAAKVRQRFRTYISVRKQIRLQTAKMHLGMVMRSLHDAGRYPSATVVRRSLPSNVCFAEAAVHQAYKQILRELGLRK